MKMEWRNHYSRNAWYFCLHLVYFASVIFGDVYLHNPRGSNNRLDEEGRERNNQNRLFDSQNNNRGGYNVGSLYYYTGSILNIEWTNQHSCDSPNSHCELILQYMCGDLVRDGVSTATIPNNRAQCAKYDCNTDRRYGMHENYDYYLKCQTTERNKGLFIADQNLKGRRQASINTRQNPGGTRRGYECPEERDYYPYWRPSPWRDIAIMTNDARRCQYYQSESQNVKAKWDCVLPTQTMEMYKGKGLYIPNNKAECEAFCYPPNNPDCKKGEWTEFPAHELPPPDCRETEFSRDNHLGNGLNGNPNLYNWTIPDIEGSSCALRIRYNISTNDYDPWNTDASENAERNGASKVDLSAKYSLESFDEAENRGYVIENNPQVKIFSDPELNFDLQLAINTAQYGRTFQDRTHTFQIRKRPEGIEGVIHNLNVRGKRGNIVQVYPAVEYDFVPNELEMSTGEYVHVQWTGSNTNPNNNDGQGRAGSDRSNVVLLNAQVYPEGSGVQYGPGGKHGHYGKNYPMHLSNTTLLGLGKQDLEHLALLLQQQFRGEMSELDDAGTYFDLAPRKVTQIGTYHYMSTRNNNFSNRDQKGRILVYAYPVTTGAIGWTGGNVSLSDGSGSVYVDQGVFDRLHTLRIESWSKEEGHQRITQAGREISVGEDYASNFLVVMPVQRLASEEKSFTMEMSIEAGISNVAIYRSNPATFSTWTKVEADINDGVARFAAVEGGVYVARSVNNIGLIVGITITCVVIVAGVIGGIIYFKKHPEKWQSVNKTARYAQRSTQPQV